MAQRSDSRETLDALRKAAHRVAARDGVPGLTLDAVAREAGVSKGTVLYHFKTKDDLVLALVDSLFAGMDGAIRSHRDADPAPGGWARSYVRMNAEGIGEGEPTPALGAGLLAAVAYRPDILAAQKVRFAEWQRQAEADGGPLVDSFVAMFASDGLWLSELLGYWRVPEKLRKQVVARLLELTRPPADEDPKPSPKRRKPA
jgi:AcrR family transcriptional regulator